jgi:D-arabinose 1-dehydrogenase-like Zn-dependent alcohol dehydrogenase
MNIFITGATGEIHASLPCFPYIPALPLNLIGYIGGSVLTRLLNHPKSETFSIRALVRSTDKATKLKAFGVDAVVGSHSDSDLLTTLSSQADVVFTCVGSTLILNVTLYPILHVGKCRRSGRRRSHSARLATSFHTDRPSCGSNSYCEL